MEYELVHWGVKGMRWGVRRYQKADGSLTLAGKMRAKRLNKERIKNLEKARKAKAEQKRHEEDKERVLQRGSASEVLKYKGELTQQEMAAAWNRIQWERNMSSVASSEISAGKAKVDKLFKSVEDLTAKTNTAIKAWNTFANVYNGLNKDKEPLPKISGGDKKSDKKLKLKKTDKDD